MQPLNAASESGAVSWGIDILPAPLLHSTVFVRPLPSTTAVPPTFIRPNFNTSDRDNESSDHYISCDYNLVLPAASTSKAATSITSSDVFGTSTASPGTVADVFGTSTARHARLPTCSARLLNPYAPHLVPIHILTGCL
ncbi:unnamed protein product [Heligmosomoides polygyrus]|uniref:Uncharacterized protein n=1 Tax=Heligmosomoides polygyrus TaxID=6339 RepID=A0A183G158_HELPZ|nr:unnamed protein product [Heligmosomoides polygyrus]